MKYFFLSASIYLLFFSVQESQAQENSSWHLTASNVDPSNYHGITVANGIIGLVSSPEPMKVQEVVLNGVYDYYRRGKVSNILQTFNHANMTLDVDGNRISQNNIRDFKQSLDMKKAQLVTSFEYESKVKVKHKIMALRHLPYSALIEVEVKALEDVRITPASEITAPDHLRNVRNVYAQIDRPHILVSLMTSSGESPSGAYQVAASNTFILPEEHGEQPRLIHEDWDFNRHLLKFHKNLEKGTTYRFGVVVSATSSKDYSNPEGEAERLTTYALLQGLDELMQKHEESWEQLWKSDIVVSGDLQAQKDIRSALYHLYSFARSGTSYSLSPMGLSGLGYNGHVFWDTELWMYPPILMLQPEIARSLLDYRFQRLNAAKQNAFAHGYDGAMYPWESADDGSEDTPPWALTGAFEHHITGCIAWAFFKYFQVTGDERWLKEKGFPVLVETAKFWVSRVEKGQDNKFHINNVIAADEWAENVDDNAFTNAVAKANLNYATKAAEVLGEVPDPRWKEVADGIVILSFENGVTREHATYNGEEIKQADVNLLAFPLETLRDEERIRKDLEYYEPRMSKNGPAMGPSVLSVLYNRLGNVDKAYSNFIRGYKPNEVPPFGVIAETAGGSNPYFATGAGGMLQAVLSGFGGLHIGDDGIQQRKSVLPEKWKSLTITGVGKENKTFKVK
jgi:trehalose/maltose hydrolase-like predicted phosphorylase